MGGTLQLYFPPLMKERSSSYPWESSPCGEAGLPLTHSIHSNIFPSMEYISKFFALAGISGHPPMQRALKLPWLSSAVLPHLRHFTISNIRASFCFPLVFYEQSYGNPIVFIQYPIKAKTMVTKVSSQPARRLFIFSNR